MELFNKLFLGRINRRTYFIGLIPILFLLIAVRSLNDAGVFSNLDNTSVILFILLPALIAILYLYSITIRRLHDVGEKPTGAVTKLVLFMKGQNGANKYGNQPEPKIDIKGLFGLS